MKKVLFFSIGIIAIAGILYLALPHLSLLGFMKESQVVEVNEKGFSRPVLIVEKNTRVVFRNTGKESHWPASDFHPTHGIYPEFDPLKGIASGEEWAYVFKKTGKWKYHDHLYPELKGVIEVN